MNPPARALAEWLAYQQRLHPRSIDLGLERVSRVAQRLELLPLGAAGSGAPRSVIVGGTNGKGSTAAFIAALAQAHGMRVGLFTSPHLLRYEERIRVNGEMISVPALVAAFEQIEAARGTESLTFFEFNALAALLHFRTERVQLAVLEVGLGGRLDATNIIDAEVAVLCSVGFDHRDWLGDTLEAIGREKAGIFRAGQTVVLGSREMPASVQDALRALACRTSVAELDFSFSRHADHSWDYRDALGAMVRLPAPALHGAIQYRNAATAIAAVRALLAPRALVPSAVARALRELQLPGRLQVIPGPVEWLLDVAHNEAAAAVLAAELRARPPPGHTIVILGMLNDKDVAAVGAQLDALVDRWLLCSIDEPRGLSAQQLCERLGALPGRYELLGSVGAGCARARASAAPGDRVVVCGSFHTVGPALQWLGLY
ncbi:MAG: bifunctional tetrahydrofolate synthase/dihydrofolate synthase [Steroidobacteraceae bacterium]